MFTRRVSRLSLLLCLAVLGSAWVPIPVSTEWVRAQLPDLEIDGDLVELEIERFHLRWGTGRLEAKGVRVLAQGRERIVADRLIARVGLPALLSGNWTLRRLILDQPEVFLDRQWLDQILLEEPDDEEPTEVPRMPLHLQGGVLHYRDAAAGLELDLAIEHLIGDLDPEATRLRGRLHAPFGMVLQGWFVGGEQLRDWELTLTADAEPLVLAERHRLPIPSAQAEALELVARCGRTDGGPVQAVGRLDLRDGVLRLGQPELTVEEIQLGMRGDLEGGFRLDAALRVLGVDLEAEGSLQRTEEGTLALRIDARAEDLVMDKALVQRIQDFDPGAAEGIGGVEPRGRVPARLAFDWSPGSAPRWVAHGDVSGITSTFRGYLEGDGDKPSFPYPVDVRSGSVLATNTAELGTRILVSMDGAMGAGSMRAEAAVQVGGGPAGVVADLHVRDFELDRRVTSAVAGTPDLASLWRDFGHPEGGTADLDVLVRRPWHAKQVSLRIAGRIQGTRIEPSFLPVPGTIESMALHWQPGHGSFQGTMVSASGLTQLRGEVASVLEGSRPSIWVQGKIVDVAPDLGERRVLETYLELPEGASKLAFAGPQSMHLDYRRPGTREHAQVLVRWEGAGGSVTWEPSGARFEELDGTAWIVRHREQTLVSLPELRATVSGGLGEGSFVLARAQADHARHHRAVFRMRDLQVARSVTETVRQAIFGEEPGPTRFGWGGEVDAVIDFDPLDPGALRARADLRPLRVWELGEEADGAEFRGPISLDALELRSPALEVTANAGAARLSDLRLYAESSVVDSGAGGDLAAPPAAIRVETVVDADPGIEMGERFAALLSPDAWAAIQRLGMTGCLGARALAIDLRVDPAGEVEFTMNGWVLPRHIRIQAPPRLEGGSAEFLVRDFRWRSPTEFDGEIRLEDGSVRVSGLQLDQARAEVSLTPDSISFRRFVARTLDGRVFTRNPASEAPEDQGIVRVSLTPDVPLRVQVWFDRLSLEAMRDELDLGGNLAGKLEGQLDLRSASVSPLDYQASGWFEIADGVLGTVPVLASIWQFAGIDPPQFSEVRMEWRTHPKNNRGRVRIDSYELRNPALLEVTGDGWVGMDGELDLNARIRDLSVVGWLFELPIVVDLFDLLIEQNVYGPLERPRVVHRAADKLFSQRPETIPYPLWVPAPQRPDWRLSPAIPASMLQDEEAGDPDCRLHRDSAPQP